jgi:predicted dienelactone hydrolase
MASSRARRWTAAGPDTGRISEDQGKIRQVGQNTGATAAGTRSTRGPWDASVTALFLLACLVAPAPAAAVDRCLGVPERSSADFSTAGPLPWGVRTLTLEDTTRATPPNGTYAGAPTRHLVTEVWYPALAPGGRNAPLDPAGAPYPTILYGHGFSAFRTSEVHLAQHLAARGYVIAAPDFPLSNIFAPGDPTLTDVANQPGDLRFVLNELLAMSADGSSPFANAIDADRIGASGLSLGGLTTLLLSFHRELREPRIKAAFAMAAPSCFFSLRFFQTAHVPLLLMHGDSDLLVPWRQNGMRPYRLARDPGERLAHGLHVDRTGFRATGRPPGRACRLPGDRGCQRGDRGVRHSRSGRP